MLRRLVAVAVLAAATLLPAAQATAGTDPDPMAGAPAVGDCFDLTARQADKLAYGGDPVDCASNHTAVVMEVGQLPSRLDWNSSTEEIGKVVLKKCTAAYGDLIGTNQLQLYRSQYSWFWFEPTTAQRDAGARWFDCMITVRTDKGLVDLPETLPRLSNKLPDVVAKCVTSRYGTTTCAHKHTWRASYTFYATGKTSEADVAKVAGKTCPNHVTTPRSWLRSSWDIKGKRFIVGCYSKDRH